MSDRFFRNIPTTAYHFLRNGSDNRQLAPDILKRFKITQELKSDGDFYFDYHVGDADTPEILADKLYGSPDLWWIVLMMNDMLDPNYDWPLSGAKFDRWITKKYPGEAFFLWTIVGNFTDGETVTNTSGASREVHKWDRTYQRLEVKDETDSTGYWEVGQTVTGSTTGATGILKRRVQVNPDALHHFSLNAAISGAVLDPWHPTENYLSGYTNSSIDTHVITNYQYHNNLNENKRNIRLLKPAYVESVVTQAEKILTSNV